MSDTTTKFTAWVVVKDALGYASIYEQPEEGAFGTGDLVAHVFQDDETAQLLSAAQELRSALTQLLAVAGFPITDRQVQIFEAARAALAKSGASS